MDLEEVLDGFDGPVGETVIGQVYPRAAAFALYVATLGAPLADRIREMFATNDLGRGWMLDAVASSGADRLSYLLSTRYEEELGRNGHPAHRVLPYSPGYCGWTVRGQKNLFARLGPGKIGVTLNDSCLMTPIKSVSGRPRRRARRDPPLPARLRVLRRVQDARVRGAHGLGSQALRRQTSEDDAWTS